MKQLWLKTRRLWTRPQKPLHKVHDCRKAGCILGADGPVHGPSILRQQNPAEGEKRVEV